MPITKYEAMTAGEFHHVTESQGSGQQCARVRRNGKTQTWKTRPDEFRLPVKFGMRARDQFSIYDHDARNWTVAEKCPRCNGTGTIGRRIVITSAERLPNSTNGNPRFRVCFWDADDPDAPCQSHAITQSDASCSYDVDNCVRSGRVMFATFTPAFRLSTLAPVNPLTVTPEFSAVLAANDARM